MSPFPRGAVKKCLEKVAASDYCTIAPYSGSTCIMNILDPLQSAAFIDKTAKCVNIDDCALLDVAKKIFGKVKAEPDCMKRWDQQELNPKSTYIPEDEIVNWIFFADTLNFSFWSEDEDKKFGICYNGKLWTGYWSLCAAMNRALDEGVKLTDPKFYSIVSAAELQRIFKSDTPVEMPLLNKRLEILHQTGNILLEKFDGSFITVLKQAEGSARRLLSLIVDNFPSFRDEATFLGQKVSFYKRAQILIGDIWSCFHGKGLGEFSEIDSITMFADYRIPQTLAYFGILNYSENLRTLLDAGHVFETGDPLEVELRGCSIQAVHKLTCLVREMVSEDSALKDSVVVNNIVMDHFLWDYRRENDLQTRIVPFHRIRSIYY